MIRIDGVDQTLQAFLQYGAEVIKATVNEARASAQTIARNAQRRAPANHGALRRGITVNQLNEVSFEVVSNQSYSAYIEFGTKGSVQIPTEFAEMAAQARGAGLKGSLSAREAIFKWCQAKGFPKNAWWPIYQKIMTRGISPTPFLIPSFEEENRNFIQRVQNILAGR